SATIAPAMIQLILARMGEVLRLSRPANKSLGASLEASPPAEELGQGGSGEAGRRGRAGLRTTTCRLRCSAPSVLLVISATVRASQLLAYTSSRSSKSSSIGHEPSVVFEI